MRSSLHGPPKSEMSAGLTEFSSLPQEEVFPGSRNACSLLRRPSSLHTPDHLFPATLLPAPCLLSQLENCHSQAFACSGPRPPPLTMPIGALALVSQETAGWREGKSELRTYECIMLNILEMDGPSASPSWGSKIVLGLQKSHY